MDNSFPRVVFTGLHSQTPYTFVPRVNRLVVALVMLLLICSYIVQRPPTLLQIPATLPHTQHPYPATATDFRRIPLSFVPNAGQSDAHVRFQLRALGGTLFFTSSDIILSLPSLGKEAERRSVLDPTDRKYDSERRSLKEESSSPPKVVHLQFEKANPTPSITAIDQLPGIANYFIGKNPSNWRTGVPTFGGIIYHQLYPGIDLRYDGTEGQMKGTYVVAPGADPTSIHWHYQGATRVAVAQSDDLIITLPTEPEAVGKTVADTAQHNDPPLYTLTEGVPTAWQDVDGRHVPVTAHYVLINGRSGRTSLPTIGFDLGNYDRSRPLTIDPTLVYSTYLGGSNGDDGSGVAGDYGSAIAVDGEGSVYVTGSTSSTNFPTVNPLQGNAKGGKCSYTSTLTFTCADVFVSKLNAAGTALLYSTYIGGSNQDRANGIAVDGAGNAYIVGNTLSTDFPTANPLKPGISGSCGVEAYACSSFVVKLNPSGNSLIYSTYLGGSHGDDYYNAIATDGSGNAYITGATYSNDFPVAHPLQSINHGVDAFVTKINPSGSAFIYSTYLGGNGDDFGRAIVADAAGNAYVTGVTGSVDFPTSHPLQPVKNSNYDVFVAKLSSTGTSLVYSTFIGGRGEDSSNGIALDGASNVYITGETSSPDFPLSHPLQSTGGGTCGDNSCVDAFVVKLSADGNVLLYSTYLGGNDGDSASAIAVDSTGNAYITGGTKSSNFPTASPLQPTNRGNYDAFITKLSASGDTLLYSTYLGGRGNDFGNGIAIDNTGNAYIVGNTESSDFPTIHALQPARSSKQAFIAKISDGDVPSGESHTFPETGQVVSGQLLDYWNRNGSLPVFGLPLTPEQPQQTPDGAFRTQLFERNRLELHPEKAPPYDVLLGRLGADLLARQGRSWETLPREVPKAGCEFFDTTGHNLCEPFLSYWHAHGLELGDPGISKQESLALFGLPLTTPAIERNSSGDSVLTQWFERARFEYHPENALPYNILLGRLGAESR